MTRSLFILSYLFATGASWGLRSYFHSSQQNTRFELQAVLKDLRLETFWGRLALAARDEHDEAQLFRDLVVKGVTEADFFSHTQLVAAARRVRRVTLLAEALEPYTEVCARGVLRERAAATAPEPAAEGLEWKVIVDEVRKRARVFGSRGRVREVEAAEREKWVNSPRSRREPRRP